MENASKALLIAAAILVVIILIAVGMKIYSSTTGAQKVGLDTGKTIKEKTTDATLFAINEINGKNPNESRVSELNEGEHVIYTDKNGAEIDCIVLYDSKSINYSTYGVQIITADTYGTVVIGNGKDDRIVSRDINDGNVAIETYTNVIEIINNATNVFLNTKIAKNSRNVGSVPDNPYYKNTEKYYIFTRTNFSSYNGKFECSDSNYKNDFEQMKKLGINKLGKSYLFASRYLTSPSNVSFEVRKVDTEGKLDHEYLFYIDSKGVVNSRPNSTRNLRPVFTLKDDIKVITNNDKKYLSY